MIREFNKESVTDRETARAIHEANGLPANCMPDVDGNPLFVVNGVYEHDSKPALMVFLKVTNELFLLVDHAVGTPEERWAWLQELTEWMKHEAWLKGFEQLSCFVPPEIAESFGKRLEALGFVRSPYIAYSLNL